MSSSTASASARAASRIVIPSIMKDGELGLEICNEINIFLLFSCHSSSVKKITLPRIDPAVGIFLPIPIYNPKVSVQDISRSIEARRHLNEVYKFFQHHPDPNSVTPPPPCPLASLVNDFNPRADPQDGNRRHRTASQGSHSYRPRVARMYASSSGIDVSGPLRVHIAADMLRPMHCSDIWRIYTNARCLTRVRRHRRNSPENAQ